jgi:hypothetical protein
MVGSQLSTGYPTGADSRLCCVYAVGRPVGAPEQKPGGLESMATLQNLVSKLVLRVLGGSAICDDTFSQFWAQVRWCCVCGAVGRHDAGVAKGGVRVGKGGVHSAASVTDPVGA